MKIIKHAIAGTLESSDLLVKVAPSGEDGLEINIQSTVGERFGKQIRQTILDIAEKFDVSSAIIEIDDKGALDCIIKARVQAALLRGAEEQDIDWKNLS